MERALNLGNIELALGAHQPDAQQPLPTPQELQGLLAEAEVRIFLRETTIPPDLLRTGWYLHGVASASSATELYSYSRQRRAFEISAHIFDLALNDEDRSRHDRLELAFGAQVGYRRAELDPNATAIYVRVSSLITSGPPIEAHAESLAVEAGVALLGFQTSTLFRLFETWLRQLRAIERQTQLPDLWGTMFGPGQRVTAGCSSLLNFLAFGSENYLSAAQASFAQVVFEGEEAGDLTARWVAAHLLDFAAEAGKASVWTLLPPDVPAVARQAFTLAAPPVLTLWPPQRELFQADPVRPTPLSRDARRVVLSIPTSSGKTLIAQLMIVAHLAAGDGGVCYVAPLRSLGREVRQAMRNRLRVLAKEMTAELPDFGALYELLDSIQTVDGVAQVLTLPERLAQLGAGLGLPDVEIMTPERLAHLLRRDPTGVLERFQLFVFDEAHMISEAGRGFTLETILSFLHWKTTTTSHRIVLLSAALGNEGQVMTWLDPSDEGSLVRSDWRGPRRLHAIFTTRPEWNHATDTRVNSAHWPVRRTFPLRGVIRLRPAEGTPRTLTLTEPVGQLALRYNDAGAKREGKDPAPHSTQQYKMTARIVALLGTFGSILVVTSTRLIARTMAQEIAESQAADARMQPLVDFAAQRLGDDHPLIPVLRKGVAFHHAALPVDVLEELEQGLRDGVIRFMTCTSTLTEGVNLPVRTVVLAETQAGDAASLFSGAKLINAMGRAGRAGKESEGWIVLVRTAPEHATDFDLMTPGDEELEIRSQLASESGLEALAAFEESIRLGEDAAFVYAAEAINAFASFVWFILASEESNGVAPEAVDLGTALGSTLGFVQLEAADRHRWAQAAESVRRSYAFTDGVRRQRWARAGTSLSSARTIDGIALAVAEQTAQIAYQGHEDDELEHTLDVRETIALLERLDVFNRLLALPENDKAWIFRETRSSQSAQIAVDAGGMLGAWLDGVGINELAQGFLSAVPQPDWRLEQAVDSVASHFEHFLAWTSGVVIELANEILTTTGNRVSLCHELPAYIRYGVTSPVALRILLSGVRSRRLALEIARQAANEAIADDDLRRWLGEMQIAEFRERFDASSSELLDLLEFARTPGGYMLRSLLEEGSVEITVQREPTPQRERWIDAPDSRDEADESDESDTSVEIREITGEQHPPRLGIYELPDDRLLGLIPTASYGDVRSILDTGVFTRNVLRGRLLEIALSFGSPE